MVKKTFFWLRCIKWVITLHTNVLTFFPYVSFVFASLQCAIIRLPKKSSELNPECSLTNLFWWKCFTKQIIIIKKIENSITHWQKWLRNQTHLKCMLHVKHWKRIHFTLKRRANAFIIIKNIAQHFCTGVMLWICDTAHIKWEYQIRIQVLFKLPFSFCAYLRLLYSTNTAKEREIKKCSLNSLCLNNCTGK